MTPEFGMALDGLLRARADVVEGIVNGIDDEVWNPATDPKLAAELTARCASTCAPRNKAALQQRFGLAATPETPLFGVVSRLTSQKGLDLLLAACRGSSRQGAPARAARLGREGAGGRLRRRRARLHGRGRLRHSAMTRALAHLMQAGIGFHRRALALRALRPDPALRACAMARRRSSRASAASPTR